MLLKMSERAWRDHWYAEDPKVKPYYQVVGSKYLNDAGKLIQGSPKVALEVERLFRNVGLDVDGPATHVVTSERTSHLPYAIVSNVSNVELPEHGFAVVKAVPGPEVKLEGDQIGYQAVSSVARRDRHRICVPEPAHSRIREESES